MKIRPPRLHKFGTRSGSKIIKTYMELQTRPQKQQKTPNERGGRVGAVTSHNCAAPYGAMSSGRTMLPDMDVLLPPPTPPDPPPVTPTTGWHQRWGSIGALLWAFLRVFCVLVTSSPFLSLRTLAWHRSSAIWGPIFI